MTQPPGEFRPGDLNEVGNRDCVLESISWSEKVWWHLTSKTRYEGQDKQRARTGRRRDELGGEPQPCVPIIQWKPVNNDLTCHNISRKFERHKNWKYKKVGAESESAGSNGLNPERTIIISYRIIYYPIDNILTIIISTSPLFSLVGNTNFRCLT